ncbi:hypothetical protein [Conchiformibius steedae]|uniref:hypothetical protein n=1 Tax=Conchiformibius steedae TaxID=153493 RepID=UPI0026F20828|nr:hypothetical protein [Conchiformibius steedae]
MASLVLMLTACSSLTKPSANLEPPPPDLAQPCPPLPPLTDGKAGAVLLWAADVVSLYKDCRAKHSALVQAWMGAQDVRARQQ